MSVPKLFDDIVEYVSGAVTRIFGTSDDSYPDTGIQPFEGDFRKRNRSRDW